MISIFPVFYDYSSCYTFLSDYFSNKVKENNYNVERFNYLKNLLSEKTNENLKYRPRYSNYFKKLLLEKAIENLKYRPRYSSKTFLLGFIYKSVFDSDYERNGSLYSNIEVETKYSKLRQLVEHPTTYDIAKDIIDKRKRW